MIFSRRKSEPQAAAPVAADRSGLSAMALDAIRDGVVIVDAEGVIKFINPAAVAMTDCGSANDVLNLNYLTLIRLESKNGSAFSDVENPFLQAVSSGQALERFICYLVGLRSEKRIPVAISVAVDGRLGNRIITLRDVTKELEEEGAQMEFISTASHEMRTPVATIDGYLSLALNPQTATIDDRAKQYLEEAQAASKRLGGLFRDLLDVTKFDDGRIKPHYMPVEMVETVKRIADTFKTQIDNAGLTYQFGAVEDQSVGMRRMQPVVYGFVDMGFLQEIMNNLLENAIKYTKKGGSIYVNVLGDGDRALINVTDTGIGISADDLQHIFQKFYRADNSQTREIGGTGLGLYLVKQRVEVMGGKIWAESAFGEGSTFYVSLPRISADEYEKRLIEFQNQQAIDALAEQGAAPAPAPTPAPEPPAPAAAPATPNESPVNVNNQGVNNE